MDLLDRLIDPFRQPELLDGATAGTAALVVVGAVGLVVRTHRSRAAPIGGLAIAAAALLAIDPIRAVPSEVVLGVIAVAAAGALRDLFRAPIWLTTVASVPGAYLVATSPGLVERDLAAAIVAGTVVVGGGATASFDDRWRSIALTPALLALSAGAVYSTVPDTELALVLLGVTAVMALGGWPLRLLRSGAAGAFASVAVLAWAISVDGVGRDGSIVGACCCLGLLLVEPATAAVAGAGPSGADRTYDRFPGLLETTMLMGHAAVALYMARVVGLQEEVTPALAGAAVGFVAAGVLWMFVRPSAPGASRQHPRTRARLNARSGQRGPRAPIGASRRARGVGRSG